MAETEHKNTENSRKGPVVLPADSSGSKRTRPDIPESTVARMRRTLSHISPSKWESDMWDVTVPTSGKTAIIRFPFCARLEATLLRATALSYLTQYASPASAQRVVREGNYFLLFLENKGIKIEAIRSSIVSLYVDSLEHMSIGDAQRNSRIRAAAALFETCIENDLVTSSTRVVDFSYRFSEPRVKKRAPDQCVVDALDILCLNLENEEIPLVMRVIYFMVRLIPNRISEVLAMNLDCLNYPDLGLFGVSIPTAKETPLHIPVYHNYNFSMAGQLEQSFYELIRMQQKAVRQCVNSSDSDSDYLFYDRERGRVISDSDFNQFIAGLISKHGIRNSDGSYPQVTSHMFRHVTIGERLRSDSYSPEETMKEANHSSIDITLSYGYMSERDESKHLGSISASVLEEELGVSDHEESSCKARAINLAKYSRIEAIPFTRIIPGMGLCSNASCHPRYADCIQCSHFKADALYLEYFISARDIIQARLTKFMKSGATREAIEFEQNQLEIVDAYIVQLELPATNGFEVTQQEGRGIYAAG